MTALVYIIVFCLGFSLGHYVRGAVFNRLEWSLLKWDSEVFAYRPAQKGCVIHKGEKAFMALRLPTSVFPEEGCKYE
tara:strand:- start:153 stop:383 length:231 start_codon:yes stop_codon:yes gene_type:complete